MINLRFLGTGGLGAARSRKKLSKDYRRFPTLLIDEKIIIDPSEDMFEFEESFMLGGIFRGAHDVFITSSQLDHLSVTAIEKLAAHGGVRVFGNAAVTSELASSNGVETVTLAPFGLIKFGEYAILPLPANVRTDTTAETALNFLIEKGDKTFFYGIDGAFINHNAWQVLKEATLNAVILDCAAGDAPYSASCVSHNNLAMATAVKDILTSEGAATDSTKFVLSHLPTRKTGSLHDELCEKAGEIGFKVAYDGYFIGI